MISEPRGNFGLLLRKVREASGLSQSELARRIGMNHASMSRLEGGSRYPSRETTLRIVQALQLDAAGRAALLEAAGFVDTDAIIPIPFVPATATIVDPFIAHFLRLLDDERMPHELVTSMLDRIDVFIEQAEGVIGGTP